MPANAHQEIPPTLLKIGDACRRLSIGETKLRQLIKDGAIDLVKIGSISRVTEASILKFVETMPRVGKRHAV